MSGSLCWLARCVLKIRLLTSLLLVCCSLCPFPLALCHAWPLILSLALSHREATFRDSDGGGSFLQSGHFVPLPKLLAAKETAQVVVDHIFRIHGLPVDVVSDRGPQFISRFWKEFCRQIGASTSLSSGFHPQTNGQSERANQDLELSAAWHHIVRAPGVSSYRGSSIPTIPFL